MSGTNEPKATTTPDTSGNPNFSVAGRVALITGAARGIGLAMAKVLANNGAAVAIQDLDLDAAKSEADAINRGGGRAIAIGGDITDLSLPVRAVQETVSKLGGLHILINNAAIQAKKDWLQLSPDEIETTLRANLVSPIVFCQQAAPIFKSQKWGRIINLSSVQARGGNPHMLAYSIGKAALEKMNMALARSLGRDGVTVNALAPGWVDSHRNRGDFIDEEDKKAKGRHILLGRIGEPSDYAAVTLWLCSEGASYITGQTIAIDGGMTA